MKEVFIKKYWNEDDILFLIHFENNIAVRQIEITSNDRVFLSADNPYQENSMLFDQTLDEMDIDDADLISKQEFETAWQEQ